MYAKLFAATYTGSMYGAGLHVFAVWPWVLSNCDPEGYVEVNAQMLAHVLGADRAKVQEAIEYLCAADPNSRTPDEAGARLLHVAAFTYQIVNYEKYLAIKSQRDKRTANAERQRRYRERKRSEDSGVTPALRVTQSNANNTIEIETETDTETEMSKDIVSATAATVAVAEVMTEVDQVVSHFCDQYRRLKPKSRTSDVSAKARKLIKKCLKRWDLDTICQALTIGADAALRAGGDSAKYFRASTIFRNEENFERMIENAENAGPNIDEDTASIMRDFAAVALGGGKR